MIEGQLLVRDQIREYMDRGDALESWSYLDYFLGTYDGSTLKEKTSARGRKPNVRVPYRAGCNRPGRCRIIRSPGHDTLPYFPGHWFPKLDTADNHSFFEASMLALLKPWRSLGQLKDGYNSFADAYRDFWDNTCDETHNVIHNIQFFHECSHSASLQNENAGAFENRREREERDTERSESVGDDEDNDADFESVITEDDIHHAVDRPFSNRELLYADLAVDIGKNCGVLDESEYAIALHAPATVLSMQQVAQIEDWSNRLANLPGGDDELHADAVPAQQLAQPLSHVPRYFPDDAAVIHLGEKTTDASKNSPCLNERQSIVRDIVSSHLRHHLAGENPPQRLMIVHGQGGTGKSAMLNAIAQTFTDLHVSHLLAKTAMSGVAASIVRGQTIHTWAALPIRTPRSNKWLTHPSKAIASRRERNIAPALWLTIDEMSMLTTPLLTHLAEVTGKVRSGLDTIDPAIPFGNLNVILLGDFHQLPPVAKSNQELYNDSPPDHISQIGRSLFEQFDIVIKLDKQIRITDPIWDDILDRCRLGECTETDISEIAHLVLTNPDCRNAR